MCVRPYKTTIQKGFDRVQQEIPCGFCWACLKNKQNDLIGRGLAELSVCHSAWFVTLTYDDRKVTDPSQTWLIHKKDFQNFLKQLRAPSKKRNSRGHKLKYLAAGEYGPHKGRTHFHAVLLWQNAPPQPTVYWNGKPALFAWPWGHVDIEHGVNEKNMRYVAKYLTKSRKQKTDKKVTPNVSDEWVTYSKKPILGSEFIITKASRQAAMQVMPTNLNYLPPGADGRNRYTFYGAAEEMYFDTLFELWPDGINARCNETIYNARLRWQKIKARKAWHLVPHDEQRKILQDEIRLSEPEELTTWQKMAKGYERYDRMAAYLERLKNET